MHPYIFLVSLTRRVGKDAPIHPYFARISEFYVILGNIQPDAKRLSQFWVRDPLARALFFPHASPFFPRAKALPCLCVRVAIATQITVPLSVSRFTPHAPVYPGIHSAMPWAAGRFNVTNTRKRSGLMVVLLVLLLVLELVAISTIQSFHRL